MRYWIFIVLVFLLSCTAQGCDKGPDKDTYSQWVVEQLTLINKNVTLGEWKKIHPDESIELFSRNIGWTPVGDLWCARSRKELKPADGKGAVRFVYFYIPSVSPSQPLPSTEEVAGLIDKTCTLGAIWTQYEAPSISFGEQLARSVREAINRRFGSGQFDIKMILSRETGRWQVGERILVSGFKQFSTTKTVEAYAFLPVSRLNADKILHNESSHADDYKITIGRIQEMVAFTGITGPARDLILAEVVVSKSQQEGGSGKHKNVQEKLVTAFERWLSAAQKMDKQKQAAALLAADLILTVEQDAKGISDAEKGAATRDALTKLGAKFQKAPLESSIRYTHSWLLQARDSDINGPVGDLAFRILMENGFEISVSCGGGAEQFKKVIEQGEAYLQKTTVAAARSEVDLMVADAYRDIVALAEGAGPEPSNANLYQNNAEDARRKAIQHYRFALENANDNPITKAAWAEAWRLIVGLPPSDLRYYCYYD